LADSTGESNGEAISLDFDRRLMLQFRGSLITDAPCGQATPTALPADGKYWSR